MSAKFFQLTGDAIFFISFLKRGFAKIYRQRKAHMNEIDKDVEFIFGEKNYSQISNSYLQFDMEIEKVVVVLRMTIQMLLG